VARPVASKGIEEPGPDLEGAQEAERGVAFKADFKLPFATGTLAGAEGATSSPFAPVPQLVVGFQAGRFGLGAGFGFTSFGASEGEIGGGQSLTEVLIAPTVTVDLFQSSDHKVALYALGAPIFGVVLVSNESAESDLGFQFALGASYSLHKNFHLGLEVGPVGHFYMQPDETVDTVSIYTALVGSFVYPR
jgi:hypothetical protein